MSYQIEIVPTFQSCLFLVIQYDCARDQFNRRKTNNINHFINLIQPFLRIAAQPHSNQTRRGYALPLLGRLRVHRES